MAPVLYSPRKLIVMAALCGLLLPLLSPAMLATGPGAIVLVPLFLFGGPIYAVPCLVRAFGDPRAVEIGPDGVVLRTLWRRIAVPRVALVAVDLERETLRWMHLLPLSRKLHLVFVLGGEGRARRTVRLPLNLLALEPPEAAAFVRDVEAELGLRGDVTRGPERRLGGRGVG